jgi:hypothetical protein
MANVEIAQTIINETQDLSIKALREILNFIQFIRLREQQEMNKHSLAENNIDSELRALDTSSLAHLEEEFANYRELYPHE